MALGVVVVLGAAAVVIPLVATDRTTSGTPVAGDEPAGSTNPDPPAVPVCDGDDRLLASGSFLAARAVRQAVTSYEGYCPTKTMTYTVIGSGAGLQEFESGTTAMAVTDRLLTDDELRDAEKRCDVQQLPFVVNPITIRYHLPGVDDLTLDAPTLTKIFTGAVTQWNDPAIAALNPDAELSALPITVVSRSDESNATFVLQNYLDAEGGWTGETSTTFAGRSSQAVQGDTAVLAAVESTPGAIGYLQSSDGTESKVARLNGVAPSLDAMAATITAALPDEGLVLKHIQLYRTKPADGAYPLVSVGHALSCAGDPAVRDFLLASLNAQRDETEYLFPTGEWANRLVTLLQ